MAGNTQRITIDTPIAFRDKLPEKVDAVIIGGGVIGVFSALYLARMGKRVLICEKGRIAGEQSSRNWGWIRQQGRDVAELPIMMQSLELWHDVNREANGQCGVCTVGVNYLASTEAEMQQQESWVSVAREYGLSSKLLSRNDVAGIFSGQSNQQWVGGVCTPSDARGEPWVAVPAVAKLAREAGALIRENCAARLLDIAAGKIRGVVTENGRVACEQVVLAGGAWSSIFARKHGIHMPQLAVCGTVVQTNRLPEFTTSNSVDEQLALRRRADGSFTLAVSDKSGFFLGPDAFRHFRSYLPLFRMSRNEMDIGAYAPSGFPDAWLTPRSWTAEQVSPFETTRVLEPKPNLKHVGLMVDRFTGRFPEIDKPKILDSWAGMIDVMPDVVPVLDRAPNLAGLVVATGMSGHGFGIGPGFGRIIAQMLAGHNVEHDLSRFRLGRFSDGSRLELGPAL